MSTRLLETLVQNNPGLQFRQGEQFRWSPRTSTITFNVAELDTARGAWSLLHEVGHGVLHHRNYSNDFELVMLEVAAWQKAKEIATVMGLAIDEDHIQDCLDTYRDWLHRRSTCPTCTSTSLQDSPTSYHCHNCQTQWHVTTARFCRPYRKLQQQKTPAIK